MSAPKKQSLHNVLVVGGCGFLGHHVVKLLLEQHPECNVSVLDLHTKFNNFPKVTYYSGDITSREQVDDILTKSKPEVVIDTVSPIFGLGKDIYFKVNVDGTRTLLEASTDKGVRAFVYTSSASVVFDGVSDMRNVNESAPIPKIPMDAYNETKAIGEKMVIDANRKRGMLTISLRLSGLFGPGDRQALPGMFTALERGQTKFQLGDNSNMADFTYIVNAAYAHVLAAEKLLSMPVDQEKTTNTVDGEAFFITNGEPVPFWDFVRAVWAAKGHVAPYTIVIPKSISSFAGAASELVGWLTGKEPNLTRQKVKLSTCQRYFDIRKATTLLGYKPLVSLSQGVLDGVAWFVEEEKKQAEKKGQ
ncbi:uncharacterized protein H6S33_009216 [Morchella sextelata]|uniref:uncharacterized protein n=1 Tax=Morchella sextelata TaxID=1174677 RepID=UPI001D05BE92|nr:uncharacterized protein H6S33_009216 [Morchella sextelata]KAH0612836.1 hypothetical protein H6S33_009216 [Morchella sextelata]